MFKILIVEDDTELCQLFSHVLEKNGYHTRMVSNGQEALDALAEEYVDLIISDIMMPVMDGLRLVAVAQDGIRNLNLCHRTNFLLQFGQRRRSTPLPLTGYVSINCLLICSANH